MYLTKITFKKKQSLYIAIAFLEAKLASEQVLYSEDFNLTNGDLSTNPQETHLGKADGTRCQQVLTERLR